MDSGKLQGMVPPSSRRDPYEVLGVSRDAADQEIKSSYRKLALNLHFTIIQLATPNVIMMVALDTANDLLWMPCDCISYVPFLLTNKTEKVHITQGDAQEQAMIVSWTTPVKPDPLISYGSPESKYAFQGFGIASRYTFYNYTSGFIHHCTLSNLKFHTTYYYKLGSVNSTRNFTFSTPPQPDLDVP